MGRQLRFYLLPEDVDGMLDHLRKQPGLQLFLAKSSTKHAVEAVGKISERFYLSPLNAAPPLLSFIEAQNYWLVDTDSEVIEFDACDYKRDKLIQGRMYYQTDKLSAAKDALLPKAKDFLMWAEAVFRTAKKVLRYDKTLDAYVGQSAARWHEKGGSFVDHLTLVE